MWRRDEQIALLLLLLLHEVGGVKNKPAPISNIKWTSQVSRPRLDLPSPIPQRPLTPRFPAFHPIDLTRS